MCCSSSSVFQNFSTTFAQTLESNQVCPGKAFYPDSSPTSTPPTTLFQKSFPREKSRDHSTTNNAESLNTQTTAMCSHMKQNFYNVRFLYQVFGLSRSDACRKTNCKNRYHGLHGWGHGPHGTPAASDHDSGRPSAAYSFSFFWKNQPF